MGLVYSGVPVELALKLKSLFGIRCFVETGTYTGNTSAWASAQFERVFTIEASEALWKQTSERYRSVENIEFLHGNSGERLAEVAARLDAPTLFWLDAHWSGGVTYGEGDECPLMDELKALRGNSIDKFIMIDDASLFLSPPPLPHRLEYWPTIAEVVAALEAANPNAYTLVVDDVIVSVPAGTRTQVAEYCQQQRTIAHRQERSDGFKLIRKGIKMLVEK